MIGRDQTLVNLYTIRAGLSLISRNKDEVTEFVPISKRIREQIRINDESKALRVDYTESGTRSYFPSSRLASMSEADKFRIAKEFVSSVCGIDDYIAILEKAPSYTEEYEHWKQAWKTLEVFLKHKYEEEGVFDVLTYVADITYTPKYVPSDKVNFKKMEKEAERKSKHKEKIFASVLSGTEKAFAPHISELKSKRSMLTREDSYFIFVEYKKQLRADQAKLDRDGHKKYVDGLLDRYGSLEKALQAIELTMENKTKEALAVYDAMYRSYNDFLSVSQWKNVDALIYYISEGYADTVKEALNLMLQQKQNDRIVNAIAKMEMTISTTVSRGISSLKSSMNAGFASLSDQLDAVYRQQSLANTQLARANHAIDLSNVLSMKANMTSQQMADDISYFRSLVN